VNVAVVAHYPALYPLVSTPTAVHTVAFGVGVLWIMALWSPATPHWTCTPYGCAVGRVACC